MVLVNHNWGPNFNPCAYAPGHAPLPILPLPFCVLSQPRPLASYPPFI